MSRLGRVALFVTSLAAGFTAAWTVAEATRAPSPADRGTPTFQTCLRQVPSDRANLTQLLIEADCVRGTTVLRGLNAKQIEYASGYLIIPGPPVRVAKPREADWWNGCP